MKTKTEEILPNTKSILNWQAKFLMILLLYILDRVVDGEERWRAAGCVMNYFPIVVVHCCRSDEYGGEIVRIISARAATSHERRAYAEG